MRWNVLEFLIKQNGWKRGAEIGVHKGATTFHLLRKCARLHLYAVDSWPAAANWRPDGTKKDQRAVGAEFLRQAAAYDGSRLTVLKGPSIEMAPRVVDGSLDFVFIDADHSTEAVRADIATWAPKVRPGGMVLGHDIDMPTVMAAVKEAFGEFALYPNKVWGVAC